MREDPFTPQALDLLCREAGKQAAGWAPVATQSGPAAAVMAPTPWQFKVALASGLGLLALVVIAAPLFLEHGRTAPLPEAVSRPTAPALAVASFAAISPPEPARWEGRDLVIDFDQMPLATAIPLLARATGTLVSGAQLLREPVLVTVYLRTADVKAAWYHLLHGHASFSTSCSVSGCQVWINSAVAPSVPTAAPTAEGAQPQPRSGVTSEENESQPDGAC
jgi:hypothetical protein